MILIVPTLILSLIAQIMVKSTFARYSKVEPRRRITGAEAAGILLRTNGISDVSIEPVGGSLTDHYNPSKKTLALSEPVYGESTIAAIGVAAHETGHAIQHARGYGPLALRSLLVPMAGIGSSLGPYIAIAGIFFSLPWLLNLGILLFSVAVLFYVVTLPVEFNASSRAIAILRSNAVLSDEELAGVRKVLTAAAMTYVASALTAIASLLRLILLSRRRD
ncbi:MAG TPA: zinc metallopeptidase [Treponemataceae bacterium]|nr:zinc metallopeptidase [Treponemataceae bacterium]